MRCSMSVNKVILIGNVGVDPEIRSMNNGKEVATIKLATSESWKDKTTGERNTKTEWHTVVIFNEGLVNVVKNYINKGSKLYIEGKLQTRKWQDKDGNDRYNTEIILQGFGGVLQMLDSRGGEQTEHNTQKANGYQQQSVEAVDINDEIPF